VMLKVGKTGGAREISRDVWGGRGERYNVEFGGGGGVKIHPNSG